MLSKMKDDNNRLKTERGAVRDKREKETGTKRGQIIDKREKLDL